MIKLDFLKRLKKKEIVAISMIIASFVLVGYYHFFLAPVISKSLTVFREVNRLRTKIDEAVLAIGRIPTLKKEVEELNAKAALYINKLPKEEEFPAILENLSHMALNTGVTITKILPLKERAPFPEGGASSAVYSRKEISINALCGYHQLGMFIAELEGAERFMEVSDIRIESNKTNPKKHNVHLIVNIFILRGGR